MKRGGTVYLVGAGPGDAGLLTLRGAELLARAEVVVYDALVNRDLLKLAPPASEKIYAGKRSAQHAIPQVALNQLLVQKAREGKCVVRLKGGDPYVFGRGGEEAEELANAGVSFQVVPGISSVVAAPAYAGIPITHREVCSSYTVVTGHEEPGKETSSVDWEHLAKTPGTKVILMGVEQIGEISRKLVSFGMKASTPVSMIRWGTTGQQQSLVGELGTIGDLVREQNFSAPAVTVIGEVVRLRKKLNWFENLPFFGRRVVVTRTREQASALTRELHERGAEVLEIPTIKTVAPTRLQNVADALIELNSYDWLVFTSPNGVTHFFEYFFKAFQDMRDLGGARLAAVGPATAAELEKLHLKVELMPGEYLTSKIAEAFKDYESIENLKMLLLRAEQANPELPRALEELGAIVDDVACYKTVPETEDLSGAAARFEEVGADWITFTSSSTVENFHQRFNLLEIRKKFPGIKLASIGPETSKAIRTLGLEPDLESRVHTIAGLVTSLESAMTANAPVKRKKNG